VRHSAGADLTYQLFGGDGAIAQANALQCYIEYQSARDVQNIVSGIKNDVQCKSVVAVGRTAAAKGDGKGKAGATDTGGSH
jgi:hypothetical protein